MTPSSSTWSSPLFPAIQQEPADVDILSEPAVFVSDVAKKHEWVAPCHRDNFRSISERSY